MVHVTGAMHGDAHGTSCEPQLFFAAVPRCTLSESSPSTASAKQKRLTKHELEEREERDEQATELDDQASRPSGKTQKVRQHRQTKPGKKLRRDSLIFRNEGTKGLIKRLALWSDVVNWKIEK